MTDDEFLSFFSGGLDIKGQRVTARIGRLDAHEAIASAITTTVSRVFLIQINHGQRIPITFEPGMDFTERMARVDAAVDRWLIVHG